MDDLETLDQKIKDASKSLSQLINSKADVEKETLSLELAIESLNKSHKSLSSTLQEDEKRMLDSREACMRMEGVVSQLRIQLQHEEALNDSLFENLNNECISATALWQRTESQLMNLRQKMIDFYPTDEARTVLAQELNSKRHQRLHMALAKKDQIAAQRNYLQNLIEKRSAPSP